MIDDYSHSDPNIVYVTENIPGPAEDSLAYNTLMDNYNSQLYSCSCSKICIPLTCKCLQVSHGGNYDAYINNGSLTYKLKHKVGISPSYPIIECNSNCLCSEDCGNRIVQKGPISSLVVEPSHNRGLGLFSPRHILPGTFVCEYAGELLTKSQAVQRSKENDEKNKMNYVFCLNEHTFEDVIQTFVDPSQFGNIGRYINHSCEPNSGVVPVRYENAIPHLAIFALKDIYPDTEITFSYGEENEHIKVAKFKSARKQKFCFCSTETCKGFMPFDNF